MSDPGGLTLGSRPTYHPSGAKLNLEEACNYAHSLIYRDGWRFGVDLTVFIGTVDTTDPIDRRAHVWVTRTRPLSYPTTCAEINHLALDVICEIEDHERLEWFRHYTPDDPYPLHVFQAHNPKEHFQGLAGFAEGKRVYRAHKKWMEKHG